MSHEVCLATWRFAYDTQQNDSDIPRSERRQEINVRPVSGGYPKGDVVVVDTEHDSEFHQALVRGVDKSSRQFDCDTEHEPEFHQASAQGVDTSSRHSEHNSEHERIRRSSEETRSAEKLNVPLRKLIVGTEHLGQVVEISNTS